MNPKVNEWHYLASAYSGLTPRAAHTAVYIQETDALYVYGGYDLNNVLGALQVELIRYYHAICVMNYCILNSLIIFLNF